MIPKEMLAKLISRSSDFFYIDNSEVVLGPQFKLLPGHLFNKVLSLFIFFAELEKECLVYLNRDYLGNYIVTVPRQIISKERVIVANTLDQVDITNGLPTVPLVKIGSIHSHHKMTISFSAEDDRSDFKQGSGFHYLIRSFPDIKIDCSVVYKNKRYLFPARQAIDYSTRHLYSGLSKGLREIVRTHITLKQ